MKTARQAGWSLSIDESDTFIYGYNDFGDTFQLTFIPDKLQIDFRSQELNIGDLPRSVLKLIRVWLGVQSDTFPYPEW